MGKNLSRTLWTFVIVTCFEFRVFQQSGLEITVNV